MDIYLVNSGRCDFSDPKPPLRNALYRNNRDGTFTDVTEKAGVPGGGYGMGVAVADYNLDGFPDLYVTQYGRSILYRNNGDGTFTDVTDKAGVAAPGWASSAVWFDYDNDGKVDLFVCRFVDFDKSKNKFCGDARTGERYYCLPRVYEPMPSYLFHNNGDGTFRDVSEESGIRKAHGKAWGAVATDINSDNWMDPMTPFPTFFLSIGKASSKKSASRPGSLTVKMVVPAPAWVSILPTMIRTGGRICFSLMWITRCTPSTITTTISPLTTWPFL